MQPNLRLTIRNTVVGKSGKSFKIHKSTEKYIKKVQLEKVLKVLKSTEKS